MKNKILLLLLILISQHTFAQFQFTGTINETYNNSTAYLSLVNDCNKKSLFFTESIISESKINKDGHFIFKGDFLDSNNRIYKIHVDNCNDNISDYKHLLNHCQNSKEILFIANNKDSINFPLNDFSQVFCDIEQSSPSNTAILKIEEFQEQLLGNLQNLKSDRQRKNAYSNYYKKIQQFSRSFNEPLAEIYAYHLYANENFLSRDDYLNDLKKSNYYNDLLKRLENEYPNTNYTKLYKSALIKDQYPLLVSKSNKYKILAFVLSLVLSFAIFYIFYLKQKHKKSTNTKLIINYKNTLTKQEQRVFELMQNNSNKEIANTLFISTSTVKSHINNIYTKLSINSRKEIAQFF